jgi:hypothetical protein
MFGKYAVKRLTASDLTFFFWHFKYKNAGNQKAINLNADVFVNQLYPQLPDMALSRGGKFPLDLFLYGPGLKGEYNLQRKIIKWGSYKNWRLDGEYVTNPLEDDTRFNVLTPGDLAVVMFAGDMIPTSAKIVCLSDNVPEDKPTAYFRLAQRITVTVASPCNSLRRRVH